MRACLVIDQDTDGVIYYGPTMTNVSAVSLGIEGTKVAKIVIPRIQRGDFMLKVQADGIHELEELPVERQSTTYHEKKILASLRGQAIFSLELFCEKYLENTYDFYDSELNSFLVYSLLQGEYSMGVQEYASLMGISPRAAYQELKLRVENYGMIKLRNFARFKKYVAEINMLKTQEDINALMAKWWRETNGWSN